MQTADSNSRNYALGSSAQEQRRLKMQASIVGKWTEAYLLSAGLKRGMKVLDRGTGMGDVALLAAEIVGPSGAVTGIDRDATVLEGAKKCAAAQGHAAPVEFVQADLLAFNTATRFDAIVGRYVLL